MKLRLIAVLCLFHLVTAASAADGPNVVFILTDD
jgi:hypothetical protein